MRSRISPHVADHNMGSLKSARDGGQGQQRSNKRAKSQLERGKSRRAIMQCEGSFVSLTEIFYWFSIRLCRRFCWTVGICFLFTENFGSVLYIIIFSSCNLFGLMLHNWLAINELLLTSSPWHRCTLHYLYNYHTKLFRTHKNSSILNFRRLTKAL